MHGARPSASALALAAGLLAAVLGGLQSSGCDRPEHALVEVRQSDCQLCHAADYEATTAPPHPGLFSSDCSGCHLTTGWAPAVALEHPWFPIENAHAGPPCTACHTVGYAPGETPTECVGCHLADYQASSFFGHESYPTTCEGCHTTAGWVPATGGGHPEDRFPIAVEAHSPFTCSQCHDTTLGSHVDGMNTDCVGCHTGEHTRAEMDPKHREVAGYPTGDAAPNFCLDCHPSGQN